MIWIFKMASFIFRCPTMRVSVQGWVPDDMEFDSDNEFISINCMACRQIHLVNAMTGRVLGDGSDAGVGE